MLNEHEREDGPEEGEYHFSDESAYESNIEDGTKAPVLTEGNSLAAKFSSYRRLVIIVAIFAAVLLLVYLVIPPLTTSTSTEITASVNPSSSAKEGLANEGQLAASLTTAKPSTGTEQAKQPFSTLSAKEKEQLVEKNKVKEQITAQQMPALAQAAPTSPLLVSQGASGQPGSGQQSSNSEGAPLPSSFMSAPVSGTAVPTQEFIPPLTGGGIAMQQSPPIAGEGKAIVDRLTALEEANTRLIGQLHAEYSQKLSDFETQNKALQEQLRTLNARVSGMEAEMNKLMQTLTKQQPASNNDNLNNINENNANNFSLPSSSAATISTQSNYKLNYTVQAIIPGRAWLRTDNGETITVAEGDVLKNLGRVTKIDPYDGTIQVDTGNRVLTLTYGNGDYS